MTQPSFFVGIDVAKAKFDAALLIPEGKYRSKAFPNNPVGHQQLVDWLNQHEALEAHLCMEATGAYERGLVRFLAQQQLLVSVVNPAQIHAFGKTELTRAKTDKADARLIARYCRMHRPALGCRRPRRSSSSRPWCNVWRTFWPCKPWRTTA